MFTLESNKKMRVNMEKVRLIKPHCNWDSINVRIRCNKLNQLKLSSDVGTLYRSGQSKHIFNVNTPHSVTGQVRGGKHF